MFKQPLFLAVLCLICLWAAQAALAGESDDWLTVCQDLQKKEAATTEAASKPASAPATEAAGWTKAIPLSAGIEYDLVSDYVFRGIDYSEFGERHKHPSHQMSVYAEYDLGAYGVFGAAFFFDWFTQHVPGMGDSHYYETDYTPYWRYNIAALATTVEIGYAFYTYPNLPSGASTGELYTKLSFDDSKLFGTKAPVLNPFVTYYHDFDAINGGWLDVGVSHKFALSDCASLKTTPFLKDISIIPSFTMGVDNEYLDKAVTGSNNGTTRLGTLLYGIEVDYNLSSALGLPEKYGTITIGGYFKYSQALERQFIDDEPFGGLKLAYSW